MVKKNEAYGYGHGGSRVHNHMFIEGQELTTVMEGQGYNYGHRLRELLRTLRSREELKSRPNLYNNYYNVKWVKTSWT